jgi:IPT/TIG domain
MIATPAITVALHHRCEVLTSPRSLVFFFTDAKQTPAPTTKSASKLAFLLGVLLLLPSSSRPQRYWPTIDYLIPSSGPVDMAITIEGKHFGDPQPNSTVTFNGTLARPTSWSDTRIVVRVPEGATTGLVRITVNGTTKSNGLYYPAFTVVTDSDFLQRIQAGNKDAIAEAGQSGDRRFVPYLRGALNNSAKHGDARWHARIALARLGETDQLQAVWCRAIVDLPKRGMWPGVEELKLIGGWFAIQGLEKFLPPNNPVHWHKPTNEEKYSDAIQLPLYYYVLEALPIVVPNPPVNSTAFEAQFHSQDLTKIWQEWIPAHKDELSKLQPAGEGVDFSDKACKNGKPRKPH